jgi:Hemerythrin HHE cation binding domain
MEADHRELAVFTGRVKAARDLPALASALDELSAFLTVHFEREERDQGIFGILADRGVSEEVDALLGEHRLILDEVRNLAQGAKDGLGASQVGERAARVASQLRDHELREHAMAERALGRGAQA